MRLVFVTQNEGPFRMRWLDELAKYMEVSIFHLNEYGADTDKAYISYRVQKATSHNIQKRLFMHNIYDLRVLFNQPYDVMILDGYGFVGQVLLIIVLYLRHKSYILSLDGAFIPQKEMWIKRQIKSFCIKNAEAWLSTGMDTDRFLIHYGANEARIIRHLLSNISINDIRECPVEKKEKRKIRLKYGLDEESFIFMYCGKLTVEKGIHILYESAKSMPDNCIFVLVGSSFQEERQIYDKMIEDGRFFFFSFQGRETLMELYEASDVFVFPTRHDVWGMVIGEAMSQGVPVIASDMCLAAKEMIRDGENGYLFKANDSRDLANRMKKIMEENIVEYGRECLNTARMFCIEKSAEQDYKSIKHFLNEKRER